MVVGSVVRVVVLPWYIHRYIRPSLGAEDSRSAVLLGTWPGGTLATEAPVRLDEQTTGSKA